MVPAREKGNIQGGEVLGLFPDKQVHCLLGNGGLPDGVFCLRPGHDEAVAFVLRGLLADGNGPLFT